MFEKGKIYYRVLQNDKIIELEYVGFTNRERYIFINHQKGDSYLYYTTKANGVFGTKKEAIDYSIGQEDIKIKEAQKEIEELVKLY